MDNPGKLTVTCPDCGTEMVVDAVTGELLFHRKAKGKPAAGKDFESLLADLESDRARAEELFERTRSALDDEERLLEEKFAEALKRAKEEPDDKPPLRPWDLD